MGPRPDRMGTWRDRSCFESPLLRCDRADGPELATHDPEVVLALARPAIRLVPAAGRTHEGTAPRGIGVDPAGRPSRNPRNPRPEQPRASGPGGSAPRRRFWSEGR